MSNTMKGRHSTGQQMARPGNIRGGQAEPAGNKVKTGVPASASIRSQKPRPNVLTNQATTSEGGQRIVKQPPSPFQNPDNQLNVKAPTHPGFRSTGAPKELVDQKTNIGCANTSLSREEMAAIGYEPGDTKSTWSIISGHATKNNQRQAGRPGSRSSNTSSRENSRMRQEG